MKNRLILIISGLKGKRSVNIKRLARKIMIIIVLVVVFLLIFLSWFVSQLNNELDTFKVKKVQEINLREEIIKLKQDEIDALSKRQEELELLNEHYSMQIKGKVEDIEILDSRIDEKSSADINKTKEKRISESILQNINQEFKLFMLTTIPSGSPLKKSKVTSKFGYRTHPITKKRSIHKGLDLRAKRRTPVYSTADGVVSFVQPYNQGTFGRIIKINHNFGFQTIYAHLEKTDVKVGDIIRKNQLIGLTGKSGLASGPHLHYEIRFGVLALNPNRFINWDLNNFDKILKNERKVNWESLVKLINEQYKIIDKL